MIKLPLCMDQEYPSALPHHNTFLYKALHEAHCYAGCTGVR